jgi:hypothetical protein
MMRSTGRQCERRQTPRSTNFFKAIAAVGKSRGGALKCRVFFVDTSIRPVLRG